jgi:hypothetical protein
MLFIATPLYENKVTSQYLHGLMQTAQALGARGIAVQYDFEQSTYIAVNREKLVRRFLKTDCLFLLFVDSDTAFTARDVATLIASNVDVVSALYRYRADTVPGATVHCFRGIDGKPIDVESSELQECGFLPTGMLLIRREVFERMYRQHEYIFDQGFKDTTWFRKVFEPTDPFDPMSDFEGEDICFSRLWREMGGKMYVRADVKVGHIGTRDYREFSK